MAAVRREPLEGFQRIFVACWAGPGVLFLSGIARELFFPPPPFARQGILSFVLPSLPFFVVALAYWRAWPGYRALVGISGIGIGLYGLALVLLGMEDVGGPKVAVPGAIACMGLSLWSLLLAVAEPNRRAAGAG
jgi:hypothetical protein